MSGICSVLIYSASEVNAGRGELHSEITLRFLASSYPK